MLDEIGTLDGSGVYTRKKEMRKMMSANPMIPPPTPPTIAPVWVAATGVAEDEALVVEEVAEVMKATVTMVVGCWVAKGGVDF
jgi:hypothetical protein